MGSITLSIMFIFNIAIILFMLRVWCQYLGVSTANKFSRYILLLTKKPLQLIGSKTIRNINITAIAFIIGLVYLRLFTLYFLFTDIGENVTMSMSAMAIFLYFVVKPLCLIFELALVLFLAIMFIDAILSWFGQSSLRSFTQSLVGPIYYRLRRFIPPLGMIDITPMILMFVLIGIDRLIFYILSSILNEPFAYFLSTVSV